MTFDDFEPLAPDDPLRAAIDGLPASVAPPQDLWAGIASQLPQPTRVAVPRREAPWWWGMAAAAALVVVAIGGGQIAPQPDEPVLLAAVDWSSQMAEGTATLEAALAAQRGEMDPDIYQIVVESLAEIDTAVARIEAAMDNRPDDPQLLEALEQMQRQRVALLRTVVTL